MKGLKTALLFGLLAVGFAGIPLASAADDVTTTTKSFGKDVPFVMTVISKDEQVSSILFTHTATGQTVTAPQSVIDQLNAESGTESNKSGDAGLSGDAGPGGPDVIIEHERDLPGGGAIYRVMRPNGRVLGFLIVDRHGYVQYVAV